MPEPEAPKGLQVERITSLSEYASHIRTNCRYNALNTDENKAPLTVRKRELGAVRHTLHHANPDTVFIAKDGERIVGFLSVKKTPQGKKAEIRQLWTALPGHSQRVIIGGLIRAAKQELTDKGYSRLNVERISPSTDFRVMRRGPAGGRYLLMIDPERSESEAMEIDISPEEENELPEEIMNTPESREEANDNGPSLEKAA